MNIILKIEYIIRSNLFMLKGKLLKIYLLLHGCKVGSKLRCHQFPRFRSFPSKNIIIGNNVTIGYNITFEAFTSGKIIIEDFVNLTQNIIISCGNSIKIGSNTLIAENVSIRDCEHGMAKNEIIRIQPLVFDQIIIGSDVWIGAGCMILKGSKIPDGSIIGANSVILRSNIIEKGSINVGTPLRLIGFRK
jgi:acetyltransferase-like isoleucine patch superfamily enzyme